MHHMAYVKGVLDGDGCIEREPKHRPRIVLGVKSRIFATKFKYALKCLGLSPYINETSRIKIFDGYLCDDYRIYVRTRCEEKTISLIQKIPLKSREEKISYITGFYDSEGNFHIKKYPKRTCYSISIYNSDLEKLQRAKNLLEEIGIPMKLRNYGYSCAVPHIRTEKKVLIKKFLQIIDLPHTRSLTGRQREWRIHTEEYLQLLKVKKI